jgi:uncharacterized protein
MNQCIRHAGGVVIDHLARLGLVTSIEGDRVAGILEHGAGSQTVVSAARGETAHYGGLVKIRTPISTIYGTVSRLWSATPGVDGTGSQVMVDIELLGEVIDPGSPGAPGPFQRGVSVYPSIGAELLRASASDVARVYAVPQAASVRVGTLYQDPTRPVHVLIDNLLGKHFAVLGTTGAGKSCATALILRAILEAYPNGHIVILDPHNEYSRAFADRSLVLGPGNMRLPYWLLNFEESVATFCSQDGSTREFEEAILKDAIHLARRDYAKAAGGAPADVSQITVDTPTPYYITDVALAIEKGMGKLELRGGIQPYLRLQARIEAFLGDDRFRFMFPRDPVTDTIADLVGSIMRVPVDGKPVTIIDLSGVPAEIIDVLVSVMCRLIFDFALWSAEQHAVPTLLVCEEAHRYVPRDESLGFGPTRRAITRIAMEGRKYGVSLGLVSNRPSELSATMLAQCNTIFALRMSNQHDHDFVRSALPEGRAGMVAALPALKSQEALVVGDGVTVPMRFRFDDLDEAVRPRSDTATFSRAWLSGDVGRDFVHRTIARWRHERPATGQDEA